MVVYGKRDPRGISGANGGWASPERGATRGTQRRVRSSTIVRRDVSRDDDALRGVRARARRVCVDDARGVGATRARVRMELDRSHGAPGARAARDRVVCQRVHVRLCDVSVK